MLILSYFLSFLSPLDEPLKVGAAIPALNGMTLDANPPGPHYFSSSCGGDSWHFDNIYPIPLLMYGVFTLPASFHTRRLSKFHKREMDSKDVLPAPINCPRKQVQLWNPFLWDPSSAHPATCITKHDLSQSKPA
eukprot:488771-Pelagomonas_calceolata.AAC.1